MDAFVLIGQVRTPFGPASVYVGRYPAGGAIAVQLVGADTGEPLGIFSTNLMPYGAKLGETEFCAKVWSENAPLVAALRVTRSPAAADSTPCPTVRRAAARLPGRRPGHRTAALHASTQTT